MSYPFKNLVFEGGGVKGIAYVGAMQVLDEEGILKQIKRVGGTSAGAINAVLFAAGYTTEETYGVLKTLDFNKFKDDSWGVLRDMKRLREDYGWYKGDFFREWIGERIKEKVGSSDATFKALFEATGCQLYVYAANVSTRFGEVYSPEHTPRMRVADAVRRSMSIPLFFQAIKDDRQDVFVDGGLLNNYPVKLFDREKYVNTEKHRARTEYYEKENEAFLNKNSKSSPYVYNKETLGFRLDTAAEIAVFRDGQEPQHHKIENFLDYSIELVSTIMDAQLNTHLHSDDWQRTIYIDTLGVKTTEFNLSEDRKKDLIESGTTSTREYLDWWNDLSQDPAFNHPDF